MKSIKWLFLVAILAFAFISAGCWGNKNTAQNIEEPTEEFEEEDDFTEEEIDSIDYEEDWEETEIETDTTGTGL